MMVRISKKTDWNVLHSRLRDTYSALGLLRMVATLESFRDRKESILRKLGVVCDADVARIAAEQRRAKIGHVSR